MSIGCGGSDAPPSGTVTGTVTMAGSPLTNGTVVYMDDATGVGGSAELDEQGQYAFDAPLRAGQYAVSIQPPPLPAPHETPAAPSEPFAVPQKFQDAKTSGLTAEVKEGKNVINFDLKT